ncbi:substrate-binding periplasmic protein [Roseibium sp. SCP14]|uniref:substrate-binding periplasmic protein n=1 Tax=Roseibium sp. SCP14 TaxID=3141375 RepID=UPI00333A7CE7
MTVEGWLLEVVVLLGARVRLIGAFLSVALAIVPARASDMVMATDDWPPFRISSDAGLIGLDLEFIEEVARRTDAGLKVIKMPWGRGLASMESGAVDVMTGLAYRDDRAKYIAYTDTPYFKCTTAFYTVTGRGDQIRSYEDLYRHQIGYVLHSAYFERFDADQNLDKIGVPQEQTLVDMLVKERFAVMIGTDCQVDYHVERLGLSGSIEKTPYNPGNKVDLYLGVSKRSEWALRLDELNRVVKELLEEGFVDRIAQEFYGGRS